MARATWLADILHDAGLVVHPYAGWETRGAGTFEPRGLIWHHTVTRPTTADPTVDSMLALTGSSKVKAPLCNYSTNRDGSVSIIAAGTANHGGTGNWKAVSGNRFFFGDEMKNLGTQAAEPWPQLQLASARIAASAVLAHIGRDASWLCGHKEYATPAGRKSDPHTLNMTTERGLVAALMTNQPGDNDEMELMIKVYKGQTVAFYRQMQAATGVPGGVADYWGSDYTGPLGHPSQAEWEAQIDKFIGANAQAALFPPAGPAPTTGLSEAQVVAIVNQGRVVVP